MAPQRFSDVCFSFLQHLQTPRSGPPAATPSGGLRPGSLRVHDPCKQEGHGSRLGFPGRRPPRGPAAPGDVPRGLQVLTRQAEIARGGGCLRKGEGRWAWTWRNLVCGRPGSRRRSEAQAGVAVLLPHDPLGAEVQGSARSTHGIVPPGKTHSPSPSGLSYQRGQEGGAEGVASDEVYCPEPLSLQARVSWAYLTLSFLTPIPGKVTTTFSSSPLPIRSRILPTPHSGCLTRAPGWKKSTKGVSSASAS